MLSRLILRTTVKNTKNFKDIQGSKIYCCMTLINGLNYLQILLKKDSFRCQKLRKPYFLESPSSTTIVEEQHDKLSEATGNKIKNLIYTSARTSSNEKVSSKPHQFMRKTQRKS